MIKRKVKPRPFQEYEIICSVCEKSFLAKRCHAETCSPSCRSYKSRHPEEYPVTGNESKSWKKVSKATSISFIAKADIRFERELEVEKTMGVPIKLLNLRIIKCDYGVSVACPFCGVNYLTYLGNSRPMVNKLWEYETHLKFQHNVINQSHLTSSIITLKNIFEKFPTQ